MPSSSRTNSCLGRIFLEGEVIIPFEYEDADEFENGLAMVRLNGRWGCIDTTGKIMIPILYDYPCAAELAEQLSSGELQDPH